eukprot:7203824-Pyramimonas_sp.AAC.1
MGLFGRLPTPHPPLDHCWPCGLQNLEHRVAPLSKVLRAVLDRPELQHWEFPDTGLDGPEDEVQLG